MTGFSSFNNFGPIPSRPYALDISKVVNWSITSSSLTGIESIMLDK